MGEEKGIFEHRIRVVFRKFPPDVSLLVPLGFDRVSVSKSSVLVRKNESTDFLGKPHLFIEVELKKDCATLRYSVPKEADVEIRRLHSTVYLLRILSLIKKADADVSDFSLLLLPVLDTSSKIADNSYGLLSKKYSDLKREFSEVSAKNKRLSKVAEENALSTIELEKQINVLSERIAKLEGVSDASLRETVLDWISSHRGSFNAAAFSKVTGVSPSRAEEGLEMLIKSGAIRRVEEAYVVRKRESRGIFELNVGNRFDFLKAIGKVKAR